MAKNENKPSVEEKRDAEAKSNENPALRGGESVAEQPIEQRVNPMTPGEEMERQAAESYPQNVASFAGQHEEGPEEARQGFASTSRAEVGRVVVLHEDTEYEGEVYKAGTQDIPLAVADSFIADGKAYEPAGKKKGR
jgi:hypothetical protein